MNFKEYEQLTAAIIGEFNQFKSAQIISNARIKGVRQPGEYEIDIVINLTIEDLLLFTIIVECKQWNKKIDRPVVQKFIQTKDAISAHKAIIVSPIGFTEEAVLVAKSNGIALWILTDNCISPVAFSGGYGDSPSSYRAYRTLYTKLVNTYLKEQYLNPYLNDHYFGEYRLPTDEDQNPYYEKANVQSFAKAMWLLALNNESFLHTNYWFLVSFIESIILRKVTSKYEVREIITSVCSDNFDHYDSIYKNLEIRH